MGESGLCHPEKKDGDAGTPAAWAAPAVRQVAPRTPSAAETSTPGLAVRADGPWASEKVSLLGAASTGFWIDGR